MPDPTTGPKITNDHITTAAGGISGLAVISSVDFASLGHGNYGELAKLLVGVFLIVLGYYSNKVN